MSEQPEQSGQAGTSPAAVHRFTLSDAATACGVSRSRIRRMLDAGAFPNATREEVPGKGASAAPWYIPASDLLAAGLFPNRPTDTPANGPQSVRDVSEQAAERVAEQELAQLRHDLALERTRRIAAEDLARERERTIGGLELALRLLEAGATGEAPAGPTHGPVPQDANHGSQDLQEGVQEPPASLWARLRRRMG